LHKPHLLAAFHTGGGAGTPGAVDPLDPLALALPAGCLPNRLWCRGSRGDRLRLTPLAQALMLVVSATGGGTGA